MYITAELKDDKGQSVGIIMLSAKEFKTGSKGFFASSKIEFNGKRYQTQVQMVEIGSKATKSEETEG